MCNRNMSTHSIANTRPLANKYTGFTLIETLIIILIVGILAAIAAPSFLSWLRNREVDDALGLVVGALKESQSEALRLSKGCTVNLDTTRQTIEATVIPPQTPPENCLPTGSRNLRATSRNMRMITSFNPGDLVFTFKKTTPNEGIIVLFQQDATKPRCVVVSEGLGLIRTGYYQGDTSSPPPAIADCQREP